MHERPLHRWTLIFGLAIAILWLPLPGLAQVWSVDPNSTFSASGEVLADSQQSPPGDPNFCCPPPPLLAVCPLAQPMPPVPSSCDAVRDEETQLFPGFFDGQTTFDLGNMATETAHDGIPPGPFAEAVFVGAVAMNGLDDRALSLYFNAHIAAITDSEGFFTRGCVDLASTLDAAIVGLTPGKPIFVRFDWTVDGDGQADDDCPGPLACGTICPGWAGAFEDPESGVGNLQLDVNGSGWTPLVDNVIVDSQAGFPGLYHDDGTGWVSLPSPPASVPVAVDASANVTSEMTWPGPFGLTTDDTTANMYMTLDLFIILRYFDRDMSDYMRLVPAGGSGPDYSYRVGRYEITNAEYADFLNYAESDLGATGFSSNMLFTADGVVTTPGGDTMFEPQGINADSRIIYTPGAAIGTRYTVEKGYYSHPVVAASWIGAAKFCNWLTLEQGLAPSQRCYTEGTDAVDWHPVTISTADWATRDLNDTERQDLVENYHGFRLPMDDLASGTGYIGAQESSFNEWYKAAAYDPAAPDIDRIGPGGEAVTADHWIYGFGRDAIAQRDANYQFSGDPFDDDDAPVGFFNGLTLLGDGVTVTTDTDNPYVMYDLSGNVWEWAQDQSTSTAHRAIRGGSWNDSAALLASSYRDTASIATIDPAIGFRILQAGFCKEDLNADGYIGIIDLATLLANYNTTSGATPAQGDIDGDGDIDLSDLAALLAVYGTTCP